MNELKTRAVSTRVGLDDAEFLSYTRGKDSMLCVEVQAWNASRITFLFEDVIAVFDHDIGDITSIREVIDVSEFLEQALNRLYVVPVPADHPFKHTQFLDLDDNPALEIVSGTLKIEYADVYQTDDGFK